MLDEQFDALSKPHRRRLLVSLLEHNPQEVANVPENVHEGDRELEALQIEMYHVHLPKLEEAGFIEWKKHTHQVVKGPQFDEIRPLLEFLQIHTDESLDEWV